MTELEIRAAARQGALLLRTGPFTFRVHSNLPEVAEGLAQLYPSAWRSADPARQELADFHIEIRRRRGLRAWLRPQITAVMEGVEPFLPMAVGHGFALLEWGMNWCIAAQAHQFLLLHAACLERDGCCVLLPGAPGAGKSTLTAALMLSGWRLLTDECTLVSLETDRVHALTRPVSLKNQSIEVIRRFDLSAQFSRTAHDTHKGNVALLRASEHSLARMAEPARVTHVVFPRWRSGPGLAWEPMHKAEAFEGVVKNAFNYGLLGRRGFERMADLIDAVQAWRFEYGELPEALQAFDRLAREGQP